MTLTASPASGSSFTGWSGGGCSGTGTCTVTMNANTSVTAAFADTQPPVLSLPANITVRAGILGTTVNFSVSATDNVDPSPTVACSPPSGSTFLLGIHTVNCTATDDAGNQSSGSFLVIVLSLL